MDLASYGYGKAITSFRASFIDKCNVWNREIKENLSKTYSGENAVRNSKLQQLKEFIVEKTATIIPQDRCIPSDFQVPFQVPFIGDCFPRSHSNSSENLDSDVETPNDFYTLLGKYDSYPTTDESIRSPREPLEYPPVDHYALVVRESDPEVGNKAEQTLLSWNCEFWHELDQMGIDRSEFVLCLNEIVLQGCHHPKVETIVSDMCRTRQLDVMDGEELLYLMVGKAYQYDVQSCQTNFTAKVREHVKVQEAIKTMLEKENVDYLFYDELEMHCWVFCENKIAPRSVKDFESCLEGVLKRTNMTFRQVEQIFGPSRLIVQVGPHESILAIANDVVSVEDEFYPLENDAKYAKEGALLCKSHWGHVYKLGGFDTNLIVKVISQDKWERKKQGLDKWNDDVALEIETHRYLTTFNHPNIVRFEAATRDHLNIYYYQEAGVELFAHVQSHRKKFWNSWKKTLARNEKRFYLKNKSPWEERVGQIFKGIFEGVQFLHEQGITHRDIKLENMVVVGVGGKLVGKLIDFGVTLRHGIWEPNMQGQGRVGTYPFFSPEMCFNNRRSSARHANIAIENYEFYDSAANDVWCLGQALWACQMEVLLWSDISSKDTRFTVATRAAYTTEKQRWVGKRMGLRYLARRFGPERNEMSSDQFIDLLEKILVPESKRYTVQECLAHPWLTSKAKKVHQLTIQVPAQNVVDTIAEPLTPIF